MQTIHHDVFAEVDMTELTRIAIAALARLPVREQDDIALRVIAEISASERVRKAA